MSATLGFNKDDTGVLLHLVMRRDIHRIVEWLEEHVRTKADLGVLLEFLCRVIHRTWPMGITKDIVLRDGQFWAMGSAPDSPRDGVAATQLITASLNADWDMVTALIKAALKDDGGDENYDAKVTLHVIAAVGDGLRAAADRIVPTEGEKPR